MTIRWKEQAERNLALLTTRHARFSETRAYAMEDRVLQSIDLLSDFPNIGHRGLVRGTLELVVPETPYVVVYRLQDEVVEILRVLHGARLRKG